MEKIPIRRSLLRKQFLIHFPLGTIARQQPKTFVKITLATKYNRPNANSCSAPINLFMNGSDERSQHLDIMYIQTISLIIALWRRVVLFFPFIKRLCSFVGSSMNDFVGTKVNLIFTFSLKIAM